MLVVVGCILRRFALIHKITTKVSRYGGLDRTFLAFCDSQNAAAVNWWRMARCESRLSVKS
jgi:hypothetical protein